MFIWQIKMLGGIFNGKEVLSSNSVVCWEGDFVEEEEESQKGSYWSGYIDR